MEQYLRDDRDAFFDDSTTQSYSVGDDMKATAEHKREAIAMARQSDQRAALGCMKAFGTTDFRDDLEAITVPRSATSHCSTSSPR